VGVERGPKREKFPILLIPPHPQPSRKILAIAARLIYANLFIYAQDAAFTGLRFFTTFRRIPPARPAAIRRAFLLEELSYPPVSDPLSSGLLAAVSFSPGPSRFKNFPPNHRNSPMSQVFLKEARVALDSSKRINSPSSACAKSQNNKLPARTRTLTM